MFFGILIPFLFHLIGESRDKSVITIVLIAICFSSAIFIISYMSKTFLKGKFDIFIEWFLKKGSSILIWITVLFFGFNILILLIGYIYPVSEKMDLRSYRYNYVMIDDADFYEDPYAEDNIGPYEINHDGSGIIYTWKFYVSKDVQLEGLVTKHGVIQKSSGDRFAIINEDGDHYLISTENVFFEQYALLHGYKAVDGNSSYNYSSLFFGFVLEIFLKNFVKDLLFVFLIVILGLRRSF